jgi:hypothetical protein
MSARRSTSLWLGSDWCGVSELKAMTDPPDTGSSTEGAQCCEISWKRPASPSRVGRRRAALASAGESCSASTAPRCAGRPGTTRRQPFSTVASSTAT